LVGPDCSPKIIDIPVGNCQPETGATIGPVAILTVSAQPIKGLTNEALRETRALIGYPDRNHTRTFYGFGRDAGT